MNTLRRRLRSFHIVAAVLSLPAFCFLGGYAIGLYYSALTTAVMILLIPKGIPVLFRMALVMLSAIGSGALIDYELFGLVALQNFTLVGVLWAIVALPCEAFDAFRESPRRGAIPPRR